MKADDRIARVHRRTATAVLTTAALALALGALAAPAMQAQTLSVLHSFTGGAADGSSPDGGVIMDAGGNIFGTTIGGGSGYGTIFKIDTSGNETVLYSFDLTVNGSGPVGSPVMDAAGNLYGITGAGGTLLDGTVFKRDTAGNVTVLYNTPQAARAGLIRDAAGNLYGTTYLGGATNNGNVFKLSLDGSGNPTVFTELHAFASTPSDANLPTGRLLLDPSGTILYGTTEHGGTADGGTIFRVNTDGTNYAVLHSFTNTPDGAYPEGGLVMDGAGNLYGITDAGGANTLGTLFKMDSTNHVTVLYNFGASATDAVRPVGDLLMDAAGNLYGATVIGGTANLGTVFKLDTTGHLTVLHSFTGTAADGNDPLGGLIMDAAGNLYGATLLGGASNLGTVYKLTTPPPVNNFTSFTAQVVVSRLLHSTAVAGEFSSASSIDPTSQAVTLSVAGTNSFSWTFAPGSFKKLFGVYVASSANVSMLLVPLKNGNWSYSASVVGFVPGSTSVTVTLTIPPQSGSATVNATVF